jgi:isoleucyl-tRNA synthetase
MGHALNRMLKDFINRHKVLRGHAVNYIPGWDCHGLPIEQKAIKQKHTQMDPVQIRQIARRTALDAIELQKSQMQELGVMADWSNIYRTLDGDFEKRQLDLFRRLLKNGFIQHRLKPVYYSPSSRTALAESELVYKEITSRSIYVGFDALWKGKETKLVIWTTTPWSLPSNMAVAVDQALDYVVVDTDQGRLIAVEGVFEGTIVERIKGADLLGLEYTHLFGSGTVIHSPYVTADGTGLVHTAPAHGHEDYEVMRVDKPKCPIDDDGNFVNVHPDLDGRYALESIDTIIQLLGTSVLREKKYDHRYPCDWKTKKPVMIRATPQWFCDLSTIKPMAIQALDKVKFYPASGKFTNNFTRIKD